MDIKQIGAFVEYVVRPLSDDWRQILEKMQELKLPITEKAIKQVCIALGFFNLIKEIIRSITYVVIAAVMGRVALAALLAYR